MSRFGFNWLRGKHRKTTLVVWGACCRFVREARSSTAVEFALVAPYYFLVLLFAVEGGIFYIKVDTLDLATEQASRLIIINNIATAPATAAAFVTDIANASRGVLQPSNISVSVQMVAPISGTVAKPVNGFQSLSTVFTPSTFQYVPGACRISTNETTGVITVGACTGACTLAVPGTPDSGYVATSAAGIGTLYQIFTCSAGQDIQVKVQYTDSTLTKLVVAFFGPVISTLDFQAEPSLS